MSKSMYKIVWIILIVLFYQNIARKDEYFLTLRYDKVNLRQGPSFQYPVKILYKKNFYQS